MSINGNIAAVFTAEGIGQNTGAIGQSDIPAPDCDRATTIPTGIHHGILGQLNIAEILHSSISWSKATI